MYGRKTVFKTKNQNHFNLKGIFNNIIILVKINMQTMTQTSKNTIKGGYGSILKLKF